MVIFHDLQKLLLYQKLNLGFECHMCKRIFFNRLEQLQHTVKCKGPENLKCPKCEKSFAHHQILHLHLQFHNLSESTISSSSVSIENLCESKKQTPPVPEEAESSENTIESIINGGNENILEGNLVAIDVTEDLHKEIEKKAHSSLVAPFKTIEQPNNQPSYRPKARPKKTAVKKKIGLTKIKMEDCLRCDECSCIYIDDRDYYKHMKNFHRKNMNNMPIQPQHKTKKKCRSCCNQCRGVHCTSVRQSRSSHPASNLIFKINMRDNIKDRWSRMVSQQLTNSSAPELDATPEEVIVKPDPDAFNIKPDPDSIPESSPMLQINIKTEPVDDYNF